jgi:transposase
MAVCAVLAARGCDVTLVAPPTVRHGPGRQTAGKDGQGRHERPTDGVLRGAWRPEDAVWVWRRSWRPRRMRVALASRAVPPRQQALEQRHRTWTEVGSARPGKPGMPSIRALRAGARAPPRRAPSREQRCQHAQATSAQALPQAGDQDDGLARQWRAGARPSAGGLEALGPDVATDAAPSPPVRPWRSSRSNPLRCEGQASREAMPGVDLTQSAGLERLTALQVMSARGRAMTRWPTRTHGAAWLG